MWRHVLIEFYGTVMLGFFLISSSGTPLIIAIAIWSCTLATGIISGAHFNPIVTAAILMKLKIFGTLPKRRIFKSFVYSLVQLLAFVVAAWIAWGITRKTLHVKKGDVSTFSAYFAEILISSQLILVIFMIEIQKSLLLGVLAVASTILFGVFTVSHVSGACFNPAFCISTNFVYFLFSSDPTAFDDTLLYILGPFIGAAIGTAYASFIFYNTIKKDSKHVYDSEMMLMFQNSP